MRKFWFFLLAIFVVAGILFFWWWRIEPGRLISPLGPKLPGPLEKYSFAKLRQRQYPGSEIKLESVIEEEEKYTSWLFSYQSDGKRISGMANVPRQPAGPVVVMLRGYADDEIYFTGLGTRKAAGVFAENGYITLAPDFLGFGGSDSPDEDILAARFYRPVEVLNLLASIPTLVAADPNRVAIWAHSNGGQVALSVLEISGQPVPTTLWNPVTLGFPESVQVFMSELDDLGLKVKKAIDRFVAMYDTKLYSIDHYWQDISAPLQVHQGLADPLVRAEWTDEFVATMESLGKKVKYFSYPGNDHNLAQDWDLVVKVDLEFFRSQLD